MARGRGRSVKGALVSLLLASLLACAGQPSSGEGASSQRELGPKLGREFVLEYGQMVALEGEGLKVRFVSVISDSRCPSDSEVRCVWEGYAKTALRFVADGKEPALVELNTPNSLSDRYPSRKSYLDYTVRLVELDPYPETAEGIESGEYSARLLITRK